MSDTEKRNIQNLLDQEEKHLTNILDEKEVDEFRKLTPEIKDAWRKRQIFRTDTEARISVLSDFKFPTKAAKYWQAVREQVVHFEQLMQMSFDYRRNEVKIKKLKRKIEEEKDELKKELWQIELEEKIYAKANMELVAKDRMREINMWSYLKKENDDGSFDKENVNTHQAEMYKIRMNNKAKTLTDGSSQPEVFNVLTQVETLKRLEKEGVLNTSSSKPTIENKETKTIGKPE